MLKLYFKNNKILINGSNEFALKIQMSLHKLTKYESELTSNPMIVPGNKLKFKYIFINLWNAALEGMNTTVDRQVVCGINYIYYG